MSGELIGVLIGAVIGACASLGGAWLAEAFARGREERSAKREQEARLFEKRVVEYSAVEGLVRRLLEKGGISLEELLKELDCVESAMLVATATTRSALSRLHDVVVEWQGAEAGGENLKSAALLGRVITVQDVVTAAFRKELGVGEE